MLKSALLTAVEAHPRKRGRAPPPPCTCHPEPSFRRNENLGIRGQRCCVALNGHCVLRGLVRRTRGRRDCRPGGRGLESGHPHAWRCAPTWMPCPYRRWTARTPAPYLDGCTLAGTMPTPPACSARLRRLQAARDQWTGTVHCVFPARRREPCPAGPPSWCKKGPCVTDAPTSLARSKQVAPWWTAL